MTPTEHTPHLDSALEVLAESTRLDLCSSSLTPAECAAMIHDRDLSRVKCAALLAALEDARYLLRQYHKGEAVGRRLGGNA